MSYNTDEIYDDASGGSITADNYSSFSGEYDGYDYDIVKCPQGPSLVIPILYSIIAFVGLMGNCFVVFIILKFKEYQKTVTNFYILQLAMADFLFLFILPFDAASLVYEERWIYGTAWCKVSESLRMLNYYASILFLTMMSVDRYLAINHPTNSRALKFRTKRSVAIISSIIWLLGFICVIYVMIKAKVVDCLCEIEFGDDLVNNVVIPEGYFDNLVGSTDEVYDYYLNILPGHCSYKGYDELSRWIVINFVIAFLFPLIAISVCYSLILLKISKSTSVSSKSKSSNKARKRVTYMVIALVTVFIFCWLPYYIFNLSRVNDSQVSKYVCEGLTHFTLVFAFMNSALNPYFYILMGSNIKKRWSNVLRRTRSFRRSISLTGYNQGSIKKRRSSQIPSRSGSYKGTEEISFSQSHNLTKHTELPNHDALLNQEEDKV